MLASIHPLGERARRNRWGVTVGAYLVGSAAGGASLGALFGLIGSVLPGLADGPGVPFILALTAGTGALFELGVVRARLPAPRRQVDEDWLSRYRGWVYGVGFGYQLGLGVVTIVTSVTVYLVFALSLLAGSAGGGALIGGTFGLVRALPLLSGAGIDTPEGLRRHHARFQRVGAVARPVASGVVVISALVPLFFAL